jgi:hypothetical protein
MEGVMSTSLEELQEDRLVMSVARALALANEAAVAHGVEPADSLVTISEESSVEGRIWRINYGPRDYVGRRGGDLIVLVGEGSQAVQRVIRGQ